MKKIVNVMLVLTMVLASAQAFARGMPRFQNRTWDDISSDRELSISWPSLDFGNGSQVPVYGVCVSGDHFKTLKATRTCTQPISQRFDCVSRGSEAYSEVCHELAPGERHLGHVVVRPGCAAYSNLPLTRPRMHTETTCVRWPNGSETQNVCQEYRTVTAPYATQFQVPVYRIGHGSQSYPVNLEGWKVFEIPACAQ